MADGPAGEGRDMLLALYYEGGTGGLFDPICPEPADGDLDVAMAEAAVKADPEYVDALAFLGNHYTRKGEHARGLEMDLRLVRLRPDSARVRYNLACSYALLGRPEDALEALSVAVERGFGDVEHLRADPDLKSLRDDPRFTALVERAGASRGPTKSGGA